MANPTGVKLDRLPPHSVDAEQALLGCILLDGPRGMTETDATPVEAFYDFRHQTVFHAMRLIWSDRRPVNAITVIQQLSDGHLISDAGGLPYVSSLPDLAPTAYALPEFLRIVEEKHLLREMLRVCTESAGRVQDCQTDVDATLDQIEQDILGVRKLRSHHDMKPIKELVQEAITTIEEIHSNRGAVTGLPTGFIDFDRTNNGLDSGEMTVIAAYPGIGKTAIAMNIAEHVVLGERKPVGVFSLEMSAVQLVVRCICSHARVNLQGLRRTGVFTERDFPRIASTAGSFANAAIYFDDTPGISVYQLRARARRMWQKHGVKLIVIDYLQLLHAGGGPRKVENRQQEVSDISRGLKALAMELRIPIIVLSQLNDDGKLRESRAIGQDADRVCILEPGEGNDDAMPVTLNMVKNRNGPSGVKFGLTFLKAFTRFESASKISDDDVPTQGTFPDP